MTDFLDPDKRSGDRLAQLASTLTDLSHAAGDLDLLHLQYLIDLAAAQAFDDANAQAPEAAD